MRISKPFFEQTVTLNAQEVYPSSSSFRFVIMKVYSIKRTQFLPISPSEAWSFFSSPENLSRITPKEMNFRILHVSGGDKMYAGQLIQYHIRVVPFVDVQWVTEITHVKEPEYFVDEQRYGPYSLWHHQHWFKEVTGGIEMSDEVNYGLPFGFIGRLTHSIFVAQKLNAIFDYRFKVLREYFGEVKT